MNAFEAVIGLEVHAQLRTATKLFCACDNGVHGEANTAVCEVCLGYPGALPVLNAEAVRLAVKAVLALGGEVARESAFDRKCYRYPDLPKGFQITQQHRPIGLGGTLCFGEDRIALERLHLEEDAAKSLHEGGATLVDFNRAGVPLVEIVTAPVLQSPEQAEACFRALQELLVAIGATHGNLEAGHLRCDANVSLRCPKTGRRGERVELKNINSFRFVRRALAYEIGRQGELLAKGQEVLRETRRWNDAAGQSERLRGKESGVDYAFLREPDLPPLVVSEAEIASLRTSLPETPEQRRRRWAASLGLGGSGIEGEAMRLLAKDPEAAECLDALHDLGVPAPRAAAFLIAEALPERAFEVEPERLAPLLRMLERRKLSSTAAKQVFLRMRGSDEAADEAVDALGLRQLSDGPALRALATAVLDEFPGQAAAYRGGKHALIGFFVGAGMRQSGGRADPQALRKALLELLHDG